MSSGLLKKFEELRVTLLRVLDVQEIIGDLKKLIADKYPGKSLRDVERLIGVGRGKLQRIGLNSEKGGSTIKRLDAAVMSDVLTKCGSSMAIYFSARASAKELKKIKSDREIIRLTSLALKMPDKADTLKKYLESLLADVLRSETSQE